MTVDSDRFVLSIRGLRIAARVVSGCSGPKPRCNPHLAEAEPRNTVAATGPVGLWQIVAISTWSSIPVLGCIDAPTLVVCGDNNRAVPSANSRLLAARIRDARLITVQAGHDLQRPAQQRWCPLVEQFLASESSTIG